MDLIFFLGEQTIQISFEMLCGFVAFCVIVLVIPLIGFLWNLSTKVTRICANVSMLTDDVHRFDGRMDRQDQMLADLKDRLIRLERTPPNISHLQKGRP